MSPVSPELGLSTHTHTMTQDLSLGIDIGGTFTDLVAYEHDSARFHSHKVLTTPDDPSEGVIDGVERLFSDARLDYAAVKRVVHATTLFTNALIERRGAPTGLITTAGFRDTLELRREHKYELYDLFIELPRPLMQRRLRLEVDERMLADGTIETPLDEAGLLARARELVAAGVESVAIVFLHSYANPAHERLARAALAREFPALHVSISSDISAQIREYERTSTTVCNAYIKPLAERYLDRLSHKLEQIGIGAPLFMMLSNGGLTHVAEAKRVPIQLLESGPAAGALAAAFFGRRSGVQDMLALDMGGTTAKLAVVEHGEPLIAYRFEASREQRFMEGSGLPVNISTIELIEIGAGGGSIATVNALGLLKVGPRSAGANPGPACYRLGGSEPTVTDANLLLGHYDGERFAGGTMVLSTEDARASIDTLAPATGLDSGQLAWGIHSVVNESMAAAARVHIAERGHDARKFALLVTGGGGPVHGCEVARRLGIRRLICPPAAGVASALGLLVAPARIDRSQTLAKRLSELDWQALEAAYRALEDDAGRVVTATLSAAAKPAVQRLADMRFAGQGYEVVTVLPPGPYTPASAAPLRAAFESAYETVFGRRPPVAEIELINIRVALSAAAGGGELALGIAASGAAARPRTHRVARFATETRSAPVYDRNALPLGTRLSGPAIIEESSSTLLVPPRATARVDACGNIIVDLETS
ncbi:MAG: hydantoinase/oxoprolinase family protein [Burkholderiales bacterium]|nr:hydantoinase/oxoprolinase family protein [Burkholderiales bacterium]